MSSALEQAWYSGATWTRLLRPLSLLFGLLSRNRRKRLEKNAVALSVPVVVVGNLTLGGSGKTPLLIALIRLCQRAGLRVGVISRGYGGISDQYPLQVCANTDPAQSGDEPLMIVQQTGVPLVVDPDRVAAARLLIATQPLDLILSDDGLQHYRLTRQMEIAVVDAARGLGNGQLLPEGPLRESPARLTEVDWVVLNGDGAFDYPGALRYQLRPSELRNLTTGEKRAADSARFDSNRVNAVAAIGHPERFFHTLEQLGFEVSATRLADHAVIESGLLQELSRETLVMTDKDAVKCAAYANENCWALSVEAQLDERSQQQLIDAIRLLVASHSGESNGP